MVKPRKYPQADVKILYGMAAGRCSFEHCRKELVLHPSKSDEKKQIGKIGHIIAHSPNGPRFDPKYPKEKLDSYDNWILVCPTCHDTVDVLASEYSVEYLRKVKSTHEAWVTEQLDIKMSDVSFAELEIAAIAIASEKNSPNNDFIIIPLEDKLKKNSLSEKSRFMISLGLSKGGEVSRFLSIIAQADEHFPERLKRGFKDKYYELSRELSGDALFMGMLEFTYSELTDAVNQAAGLAILSYLFHLCEIFEK